MAIYSTFFIAEPDNLFSGFPGWKLPLNEPVQRQVTDFFGETRTIATCEPLWDDVQPCEDSTSEYGVVEIQGDYAAYLERRIPSFVRESPHWCAKGLTNVELDPLGVLTDGEPALVNALFAHPTMNAFIQKMREPIVAELLRSTRQLGRKWAARMSTPEYTHSANGSCRLKDDWSLDYALSVLEPLVHLAKKANAMQHVYLLLEW